MRGAGGRGSESVPGLAPEIYYFSFFITHLSSYDNILKLKHDISFGNMKVLLGHLYTC